MLKRNEIIGKESLNSNRKPSTLVREVSYLTYTLTRSTSPLSWARKMSILSASFKTNFNMMTKWAPMSKRQCRETLKRRTVETKRLLGSEMPGARNSRWKQSFSRTSKLPRKEK